LLVPTACFRQNHDQFYVLNDIVFSPTFALDHAIYGASAEALLRSIDGGKTWQLVETPAYSKAASRQAASTSQP